jgi:hypothetical protein
MWITREAFFTVSFDARREVVDKEEGEFVAFRRRGFLEGAREWLRRVTGK